MKKIKILIMLVFIFILLLQVGCSEGYDGSIVNMGVKNDDGTICYIIGLRKDIRKRIDKQAGDKTKVIIKERA